MCRGFRSVNIVLTLYFESLETLDFTVFYSYVNGSNPLTHANRKRGRAVSSIPFLVRVRPGLERVRSTLRFGRC